MNVTRDFDRIFPICQSCLCQSIAEGLLYDRIQTFRSGWRGSEAKVKREASLKASSPQRLDFSCRRALIPAAMASLTLNGNKFSTLRKHRHCKYLSQSHIQQKSRFRDIHLAGGPVPEGRVSVSIIPYAVRVRVGAEYKKRKLSVVQITSFSVRMVRLEHWRASVLLST